MPDNKSRKRIYAKRTLAALLLVVVLIASVDFMDHFLCIPLTSDNIRVINMHKEPSGSIDVLLIGSSPTYSSYAAAHAYELYGFTSFPYAVSGATCTMWKPALQDAMRTQDPKLVVVDVYGGSYAPKYIKARYSQAYTVMTHMNLSKEKIETARELSSAINGTSTLSFIIPFLRYHTRVPSNMRKLKDRIELERSDVSPLKGIENLSYTRKRGKIDKVGFSDDSIPLDPDIESIIRNFMDYCKEQNIKVLFVKYPMLLPKRYTYERLVNFRSNRILEIADEYGFDTLDMQRHFYDVGLVESEDYYNHGHTNVRGQKKITAYLGDYIQNELQIAPSELSNDLKAEWDESVIYYHAYCELNEKLIRKGKKRGFSDRPEIVNELTERIRK